LYLNLPAEAETELKFRILPFKCRFSKVKGTFCLYIALGIAFSFTDVAFSFTGVAFSFTDRVGF